MVRFIAKKTKDGTAPVYENDILSILSYCASQNGRWIDVKELERATGIVYRRITRFFYIDYTNTGKAMPFIAKRYNYLYKIQKFPSRPGTFNSFKYMISAVKDTTSENTNY